MAKEVSLSQARNKALARLGASEHNMNAYQQPGGNKTRKRALLPLKFNDQEVENEYDNTAYLMHRHIVVVLLLVFAVTYTAVAIATLLYDLNNSTAIRPTGIGAIAGAAALRAAAALSALVLAMLVTANRLKLRGVQIGMGVTLVLLWASPLAAMTLRGDAFECPELLILYLST